jgi:hypothetical protein
MLARMLSRGNQFGTKTDSNPSSDCEDEQEEDGKGNVSFYGWKLRFQFLQICIVIVTLFVGNIVRRRVHQVYIY